MQDLPYLQQTPKKFLFDGCKLIYHQQHLKQFLEGHRIYPLHVDMGIHKSCNIRCVYCYGVKQVPSPKYIPLDRLIMLANDAKSVGIKSLAVIGDGEPTMNKGLYEFVEHSKSIGLDMSVATNGLLLDEHKAKTLVESLVWLRFNISGVDKYDAIMGATNGLHKFKKVVEWALKHTRGCTIGLQMVLIPQCFSEVVPLATLARDMGVDYLVIKQFSDGGDGMPIHMDMKAYEQVTEDLKKAEALSNDKTSIIVKWSAIKDTKDITMEHKWGFNRCIDLPFIFQISGDGGCYPCGYMFGNAKYCYGDVTKQSLKEILDSDRYWDVVDKVAKTPLKELCQGQCRHCETNKFVDRLSKVYKGDLTEALIKLCGSRDKYEEMMTHPPAHLNFI